MFTYVCMLSTAITASCVSHCHFFTVRLELTQELLEPESGARVSMFLGKEPIKMCIFLYIMSTPA